MYSYAREKLRMTPRSRARIIRHIHRLGRCFFETEFMQDLENKSRKGL